MSPQRNLIEKIDPAVIRATSAAYQPNCDLTAPDFTLYLLIQLRLHFKDVVLVRWCTNNAITVSVYRIGSWEPEAILGRDYFIYIHQSWPSHRLDDLTANPLFPPYPNVANQVLCGFSGPIKLKKIWQVHPPKGIFNYVDGKYYPNATLIEGQIITNFFFDFGQMVLVMKHNLPRLAK